MNETNDGISAAEENDFGKDTMKSQERHQSEESVDHGQSMEYPRRSHFDTGVERIEISLVEKAMYMDNVANS